MADKRPRPTPTLPAATNSGPKESADTEKFKTEIERLHNTLQTHFQSNQFVLETCLFVGLSTAFPTLFPPVTKAKSSATMPYKLHRTVAATLTSSARRVRLPDSSVQWQSLALMRTQPTATKNSPVMGKSNSIAPKSAIVHPDLVAPKLTVPKPAAQPYSPKVAFQKPPDASKSAAKTMTAGIADTTVKAQSVEIPKAVYTPAPTAGVSVAQSANAIDVSQLNATTTTQMQIPKSLNNIGASTSRPPASATKTVKVLKVQVRVEDFTPVPSVPNLRLLVRDNRPYIWFEDVCSILFNTTVVTPQLLLQTTRLVESEVRMHSTTSSPVMMDGRNRNDLAMFWLVLDGHMENVAPIPGETVGVMRRVSFTPPPTSLVRSCLFCPAEWFLQLSMRPLRSLSSSSTTSHQMMEHTMKSASQLTIWLLRNGLMASLGPMASKGRAGTND